ncbi:hypothetical protein SVA_2900 [Sulfurifustis variabilis]|uniref:Putative DNA-binding domain-containing protein n=1 Tax=Sulfurifustis variabilis TaxID=1675686 RepID=A0A1B4V7H1_9GAMM|nr:putative DNA-binding domain-containing protein [Sulfurifustis variabilis]BAU49448.1 hypothetical protein SVA_2900 [Sulfurifustis variabilis]
MSLLNLQQAFRNYILHGEDALLSGVVGSGRMDAGSRLAIYADAYRLRLNEALETDFVVLRAHLGPERFERLCGAYIGAHPSNHWSLRCFGRHMSAFLASAAPWTKEPFLAELARFEWALVDAFDAEDGTVARPHDVAAIAPARWPHVVMRPHASVQRLDLAWNAPAVWKAVKDEQPPPAPARADHLRGWVIWRQGLQNYFRPLPVEEAFALDAMLRGEAFGAICEGLLEWMDAPNAAERAAGLLKLWLTDGLVGELRLP